MTQIGQMLEEAQGYQSTTENDEYDGKEVIVQSLFRKLSCPFDENSSQPMSSSEKAQEKGEHNSNCDTDYGNNEFPY